MIMKIEIDQTRSRGVWTSKIKRCGINRFPLRKTLLWNEKQGTALSEDQSNRIELVEYHSPHWFRVEVNQTKVSSPGP